MWVGWKIMLPTWYSKWNVSKISQKIFWESQKPKKKKAFSDVLCSSVKEETSGCDKTLQSASFTSAVLPATVTAWLKSKLFGIHPARPQTWTLGAFSPWRLLTWRMLAHDLWGLCAACCLKHCEEVQSTRERPESAAAKQTQQTWSKRTGKKGKYDPL